MGFHRPLQEEIFITVVNIINKMTFAQFVHNYWQIVVSIIGLIVAWWRFSLRLQTQNIKAEAKHVLMDEKTKDLETRIAKVEGRLEALYPLLVTLQTDMASVKTSVEFIKGSIAQITNNK